MSTPTEPRPRAPRGLGFAARWSPCGRPARAPWEFRRPEPAGSGPHTRLGRTREERDVVGLPPRGSPGRPRGVNGASRREAQTSIRPRSFFMAFFSIWRIRPPIRRTRRRAPGGWPSLPRATGGSRWTGCGHRGSPGPVERTGGIRRPLFRLHLLLRFETGGPRSTRTERADRRPRRPGGRRRRRGRAAVAPSPARCVTARRGPPRPPPPPGDSSSRDASSALRRLKKSLRWALVVATLTMRQLRRMYSWISARISGPRRRRAGRRATDRNA